MKVGIKHLTYAPYTSGGDGSTVTYGTGAYLADYMVKADMGEERSDVDMYADDHKIDSDNSMTAQTLTLELANMTDAMETAFLGYTVSSGVVTVTDDPAPFIGVGFVRKERYKGTITYTGYWFYKVQFGLDTDSVNTKGENLEFQTHSLTGSAVAVTLTSGGKGVFSEHKRETTEAAALSWVKGKAGIST